MVEPILNLAKLNIEHNAKKNDKFTEMQNKYESANKQIEDLKHDVTRLKKLPN